MYVDAEVWLRQMVARDIDESSKPLFAGTEELMEEEPGKNKEGPGKGRWVHPKKIFDCPVCGATEEVFEKSKICNRSLCRKHKANLNSDNMPNRKKTQKLMQLWRCGVTFQEIYDKGGYSSPGAIQAAVTKSINATYQRAIMENELIEIRWANGLKGNLPSVL